MDSFAPFIVNTSALQSYGLPNFSYSRESPFPSSYGALIMTKDAVWVDDVRRTLDWVRDSGILHKILYGPVPLEARIVRRGRGSPDQVEALGIADFVSLLSLTAITILLAAVTLAKEFWQKRASDRLSP